MTLSKKLQTLRAERLALREEAEILFSLDARSAEQETALQAIETRLPAVAAEIERIQALLSQPTETGTLQDRKSTRLNSSHRL